MEARKTDKEARKGLGSPQLSFFGLFGQKRGGEEKERPHHRKTSSSGSIKEVEDWLTSSSLKEAEEWLATCTPPTSPPRSNSSLSCAGYDFLLQLDPEGNNLRIHATHEDLEQCYEIVLKPADLANISPYLGRDLEMLRAILMDALQGRNLDSVSLSLSVTVENDLDIEATVHAEKDSSKVTYLELAVEVKALYQQFKFHIFLPTVFTRRDEWTKLRLRALQQEVRSMRKELVRQQESIQGILQQDLERFYTLVMEKQRLFQEQQEAVQRKTETQMQSLKRQLGNIVIIPHLPFPISAHSTVLDVDSYQFDFGTESAALLESLLPNGGNVIGESESFKRRYVFSLLQYMPHLRHPISRILDLDESISRLHEGIFVACRKAPQQAAMAVWEIGRFLHGMSDEGYTGVVSPDSQPEEGERDALYCSLPSSPKQAAAAERLEDDSELALTRPSMPSGAVLERHVGLVDDTRPTLEMDPTVEMRAQTAAISNLLTLAIDSRITTVTKELFSCKRLKALTSDDLTPLEGLTRLEVVRLTDCKRLTTLDFLLNSRPTIRVLILKGCSSISDLSVVQGMINLSELDISGCTALTELELLKIRSRLQSLRLLNLAGSGVRSVKDLGLYSSVQVIVGEEDEKRS